ncbi:hypothetical protein SAY86_007606 [Trapa natans]|uniref:Cell number regulator 6 n=1 Tax=Trapa natans TaxID=22666 RepID=A0AAN7LPA4_TRANT|nr:hypothetical protein SAY86_007606 [Trapa natans]
MPSEESPCLRPDLIRILILRKVFCLFSIFFLSLFGVDLFIFKIWHGGGERAIEIREADKGAGACRGYHSWRAQSADRSSAGWTGLFCPCVLFGRNVETLREDIPWTNACVCHAICVEGGLAVAAATALLHGIDPNTSFLICESLFFAWWMCGIYTGLFRQSLQKKYHLKNSPCDPCLVHCCMHSCALCQEHREMRNHLSDNAAMPTTAVDPPPVQHMSSSNEQMTDSALPIESSKGRQSNELELQPL